MKKYLLLLLFLIPFVAYADDTQYNVVINNDSVSVSIVGGSNVSNYSNIVTYQNRVLTVHEGVTINEIDYNDIDITITSNDKVAYIGTIKGDNQRHNTLTIKNYKNDENTPFELYTWTLYAQINIEDSTIYRANIRNKDGDENIEYGATIKNTKIYNCSQINPGGPIIVEDSTIEVYSMHSERAYIHINNSTITGMNNYSSIYTEDNDGHISISNSYIRTGAIDVANYDCVDYALKIVDSILEVNGINTRERDKGVIIKNSKVTGSGLYYFGTWVNMEDSTLSANKMTIKGGNIKNSTINLVEYCYMDIANAYTPELKLDNSIITGTGYLGFFIKSEINNSYIKVDGKSEFRVESVMNNSYFKVIQNDDYYALYLSRGLTVHNSYVYLESPNYNVIYLYSDAYLRVDDGIIITDKNKTELHLLDYSTIDPSYSGSTYAYSNNEPSKSLMFSSKANVTFRVKNGTWKDGTTDDIVITKNIWEKLTQEELNKILSNIKDGSWDSIPNIDDYIKGDTVYTFTVSSVKGVVENPKTGRFFNSILIVTLSIAFMISYVRIMHKSFFKKN